MLLGKNDILLDSGVFLGLGFNEKDMNLIGGAASELLDFNVGRAVDMLKNDPGLGARLLSLAPGNSQIFWTGEYSRTRVNGRETGTLGVRLSRDGARADVTGENLFGRFLMRVRDEYRGYISETVVQEEPMREGQVIADFKVAGDDRTRVEREEAHGDKFIHVDIYRPAPGRSDAGLSGATGFASRETEDGVPNHKFECPFGISYPSPVIVGSEAEASFLYEKALRGDLDWKGLFNELMDRGLSRKLDNAEIERLSTDFKSQFDWMREQICTNPELRERTIVQTSDFPADFSLGRSVFGEGYAESPAYVLARYINNPILFYSSSRNSVADTLSIPDKAELNRFDFSSFKEGETLNILVFGSDTVSGREPGQRTTTGYRNEMSRDGNGKQVIVRRKFSDVPMKTAADRESDYKSVAARLDQVLSSVPEGVPVRFITGGSSLYTGNIGVGLPRAIERYVREKGGAVDSFNFSSGQPVNTRKATAGDGERQVSVLMMEHLPDCLPVIIDSREKVTFELNPVSLEDTSVEFNSKNGVYADAAMFFSVREDRQNANLHMLASQVAESGVPVIHVMENKTAEEQDMLLASGAVKSLAFIRGEMDIDESLFKAPLRLDWDIEKCNVLSLVDPETRMAIPFVSRQMDSAVVLDGYAYKSILSAYMASLVISVDSKDSAFLGRIRKAENSTSELTAIYREFVHDFQPELGVRERAMREVVGLFARQDNALRNKLLDLDSKSVVELSSFDGVDLFASPDGKGANLFGIVLGAESSRLINDRDARLAAAQAEDERASQAALRQAAIASSSKVEAAKVLGGLPKTIEQAKDAIWMSFTATPLGLSLPDGKRSFEHWDDEGGLDPLVREKVTRPYIADRYGKDVKDKDGKRIPNDHIFLFASTTSALTGRHRINTKADSYDFTGCMRVGVDGNKYPCAFGIPVKVNGFSNELLNDQGLPCSFYLDNKSSVVYQGVQMAHANAVDAALKNGCSLALLGRTNKDGVYYPLGNVFKDQIWDRKDKVYVDNKHKAPNNLKIIDTYTRFLERSAKYPLNIIPLPRESYSLDRALDDRSRQIAEKEFIRELNFSLKMASTIATKTGRKLMVPLDSEGRIDFGPGVKSERLREIGEKTVNSFIGVVEDNTKSTELISNLPILQVVGSEQIQWHKVEMNRADDFYIRPNDLARAFGRFDFSYIQKGQTAPLHEMAFTMDDGSGHLTIVKIYDAKMSRGLTAGDLNKVMRYENNPERHFIMSISDVSKAEEAKNAILAYVEKAKHVSVEMRLVSEASKEAAGASMKGFVRLLSSNSEEYVGAEQVNPQTGKSESHEIGREMSIFNGTSRFEGTDASDVYYGREDAKDAFNGFAQIRYTLPDGTQSGWSNVEDLDLAKDIVMSMVNRKYNSDNYDIPSPKALELFVTAEAIEKAGFLFRDCSVNDEIKQQAADDKVVRIEDVVPVLEAAPETKVDDTPVVEMKPDVSVSSEKDIRFEVSDGGYSVRTHENANAEDIDFTVAFAVDFNTPGEKATRNAAGEYYIGVSLVDEDGKADLSKSGVARVADYIKERVPNWAVNGEPIGINVAGNGLSTLSPRGITQEKLDSFMTAVFMKLNDEGVKIEFVRSGGQTGIDEAGVAAAKALGLDATVRAPKGWKFREAGGMDVTGENAFKERFSNKDYQKMVRSAKRMASVGKMTRQKN